MKVALVTGGARGIGRAIAEALIPDHAVAVLDREGQAAERVAAELRSGGGKAVSVECDVSRESEVERALREVDDALGPVAVLVNNAGVGGPFHRADEVSSDEWEWVVRTNLFSVYYFTRRVLPAMKAQGFGRIINVASIQGLQGSARSSSYVASKHGMIGYTKSVAAEFGEFGVTANAICPGYVETALGIRDDVVEDYRRAVMAKSPVKREARPAELARIAAFLAAEAAGYINGTAIVADGGISSHLGIT